MNNPCLIVGASHAAAQLSVSLRQEGWQDDILIIGDEGHLPYQRPPLSKAFLAGEKDAESLAMRPADFYEKQNIQFRHGLVTMINRDEKTVSLDDGSVDGSELSYGKLALCTGARVRKINLPGSTLNGVHYLRDLTDAMGIQVQLKQDDTIKKAAKKAVIIGGGYIGLETAASLRKLGLDVTVLEMAQRVLQRVTSTEVSDFYTRIHNENGVSIKTGVGVTAIIGDTTVEKVTCSNGEEYAADIVIVGIGVIPNTELATAAGLETENGIIVDASCRTSDPDIFAVGDCSNQPSERYQTRLRLESVSNAMAQAKSAAAAMCGKDKPNNALPWFWSDQYDYKLQIAGLNHGYDQVVMRGDHQHGNNFAAFYLKNGQLIAADCINRPQEFVLSKKLLTDNISVAAARLADDSIPVKELLNP